MPRRDLTLWTDLRQILFAGLHPMFPATVVEALIARIEVAR